MLCCQFCKKEYKTVSSLNLHKKTAKFCLKLQEEIIKIPIEQVICSTTSLKNNYKCCFCSKDFTLKQNFDLHTETCKSKTIYITTKLQEDLKKSTDTIIKLKNDVKHLTDQLTSCREDYNKLVMINAKSKNKITNNNNMYNIKLNEAFKNLPEFTKENVVSKLIENITTRSIHSEEIFVNDTVKSIKDFTIVTDPARGKAYIKNESGNKEKTYTEKIFRKSLAYYKEEGNTLIDNDWDKINWTDIENIEKNNNNIKHMKLIQDTLNASGEDKIINGMTIQGGNKLNKEGILIIKNLLD